VIQVTRVLIRQIRAALRRSVLLHCPKNTNTAVIFHTGRDGLTIYAQNEGIALEYHSKGSYPSQQLALPAAALDDFEGGGKAVVTLEEGQGGKVAATWDESSTRRDVMYDVPKANKLLTLPSLPKTFTPNEPDLLKALDDAAHTVAHEDIKYATTKVLLRGTKGEIAATDGHQLLMQNGFHFPWLDEVLVPSVTFFGWNDLPADEGVNVGITADHVCFEIDNWTLWLPIDKFGRFPKIDNVIPQVTASDTRVHFDADDVTFFAGNLVKLPGIELESAPVTLDLNGHVAVRARAGAKDPATEIVLSRSGVTGKRVRYPANRAHLSRALQLGFTEATIVKADSPILFEQDRRKFVFMGLSKDSIVLSGPKDEQFVSDPEETTTTHQSPSERRNTPVQQAPLTAPAENDQRENGDRQGKSNGFAALFEEAQALQNTLRDALLRTNQLLVGLKQYRRQAKTMQSTLATLRQLDEVAA
jgi:hypothetical protein